MKTRRRSTVIQVSPPRVVLDHGLRSLAQLMSEPPISAKEAQAYRRRVER